MLKATNLVICSLLIFVAYQQTMAKVDSVEHKEILKKIKRDRDRNAKYYKKDVANQLALSQEQATEQKRLFLQTRYNEKLAKEAEKRIQRLTTELAQSKTVGDWMNKTNPENRFKRRMNFSQHMNHKLPQFIIGKQSIALIPKSKNEKGMNITLFPSQLGIQFIVDGRNLTRQNNETFEAWRKRVNLNNGKKSTALFNWFIPEAHATEFNPENLYMNMFGLSLNDGWEDQTFDEGRYKSEQFRMLVNSAIALRDSQGLRCGNNRTASFNSTIGGNPTTIHVAPQRNQSGMIEMSFGGPSGSSQSLGTLHVRSDGYHSYLSIPGNERNYPSEAILSTVPALLSGQPLPTINHGIFDSSGPRAQPEDIIVASANLRACNAAHAAGADTSICSVTAAPRDYQTCINENFIQSDLAGQGIGSTMASLIGRGPSGNLVSMDRMAALNLKIQLLDSYARYQTNMVTPGGYPQQQYYVTYSPGGAGADSVRSFLAQSQGDELYHTQVLECFESALRGTSCTGNQLSAEVIRQLQHLATPLRQNGTVPDAVPAADLYTEIQTLRENSPAACRNLMPEDRLSSLQDYATLERQMRDPNNSQITSDLNQTVSASDVGMSCCGNSQCRNALTGVEPGGNYEFGSGTIEQ